MPFNFNEGQVKDSFISKQENLRVKNTSRKIIDVDGKNKSGFLHVLLGTSVCTNQNSVLNLPIVARGHGLWLATVAMFTVWVCHSIVSPRVYACATGT